MGEVNQEVKIVGVDKQGIKIKSEQENRWIIPFKLSLVPDDSWQKRFNEVQSKNFHTVQVNCRIVENTVRVEISGSDSLQTVLDTLKALVLETNTLCEEDYNRKIKIREELEALHKKQSEATLKFQEESDKLEF